MVPPLTRRSFLAGVAGTLAVSRLQMGRAWAQGSIPGPPFTLGVASGDPDTESVVLWTRLAPQPLAGGGMPPGDVPVSWQVAADAGFSDVVASGTEPAVAALAHSVHVEVGGLEADTWYWYRFSAGGYDSPVGRTRTTPPTDCADRTLRFAFASCQNYPSGYYTAHAGIVADQPDLVVFLGDYIYEGGGTGPVRAHNSGEIYTLADYRNRYALYRSDPDLQASHAACPWSVVWDDHEVDNNYAGPYDQDGSDPSVFLPRRAVAYQAWYEHQPARLPAPSGPDFPIYRSLRWGNLAELFLLDTRQYRSQQACVTGSEAIPGLVDPCPDFDDPAHVMMGSAQEKWLTDGLLGSGATWNVVAQQVVFAAMPIVGKVNNDQWDGYPNERRRLLDTFARPEVANPVVITGDIHASGVGQILEDWSDPSSTRLGTELVGTSISSTFNDDLLDLAEAIIGGLPHVEYVDARRRGYVLCEVSPERWTAQFRTVDTTAAPTSPVRTSFLYEIPADEPGSACAQPVGPTSTTSTTTTTAAIQPASTTAVPARPTTAQPTFTG